MPWGRPKQSVNVAIIAERCVLHGRHCDASVQAWTLSSTARGVCMTQQAVHKHKRLCPAQSAHLAVSVRACTGSCWPWSEIPSWASSARTSSASWPAPARGIGEEGSAASSQSPKQLYVPVLQCSRSASNPEARAWGDSMSAVQAAEQPAGGDLGCSALSGSCMGCVPVCSGSGALCPLMLPSTRGVACAASGQGM